MNDQHLPILLHRPQTGWVNRLAAGLDHSDLEAAVRVLAELSARLEADPAVPQDQEGNDHEH
jgi:hypothetical protein